MWLQSMNNIVTCKKILRLLSLIIILMVVVRESHAACAGRVLNPVTDLCWSCIFPISLGSAEVGNLGGYKDIENPPNPVCTCPIPAPPFVRIGATIGMWEPLRLAEVVREPFCMPSIGGMNIGSGIEIIGKAGPTRSKGTNTDSSFYHAHWFNYPVMTAMSLANDSLCLTTGGFDVSYMTEFDPLWVDPELSFLISPESVLFTNPVIVAACAADCIAATAALPIDFMFWCQGCNGTTYPISGQVAAHVNGQQAGVLLVERMTYKLHRQGQLWGSIGATSLCALYPMPMMRKSQYRYQPAYPIPTVGAKCCYPYGHTSLTWEFGREYPIGGEDFVYMVWRKRNCCAL